MTIDKFTVSVFGVQFSLKQCSSGDACVHPRGPILPLTEFNKNKTAKDGLQGSCRPCQKRYREAHKESLREYFRIHHRANPEKAKEYRRAHPYKPEYSKRYRERHRDKIHERKRADRQKPENRTKDRARSDKWRHEHPEEMRARSKRNYWKYAEKRRAKSRADYWADPQAAKKKRQKYAKEHPDRVREQRRASQIKSRARRKTLPRRFKLHHWTFALEYFNHCCAFCGEPFGNTQYTGPCADHWYPLQPKFPLSRTNPGTIPTNILPACRSCNSAKGNKEPVVWVKQRFGNEAPAVLERVYTYFRKAITK